MTQTVFASHSKARGGRGGEGGEGGYCYTGMYCCEGYGLDYEEKLGTTDKAQPFELMRCSHNAKL